MANYIGKIAAVGTINMSQVSRGLQTSAKEYERYGKGFARTISQANADAARSFSQVFTQTQRLERAINARSAFKIDTGGAETRLRAIIGAAEDIAKPLAASAKVVGNLSAVIQNEFAQAFVRAGNAAETAQEKINRGVIRNTEQYQRYKRVVDEAVISVGRLSEAGAAVSGLATGRELRFQQAGLAAELQRSAASQAAASALPADARRSGAVAQLVELQRREAEEAARLLAVLENIRNTRRGDAAAAQAALDAQVKKLAQVNSQLERQSQLSSEVAARQREVAAAQERSAAAFSANELNRRDGTLARRNSAAFDTATAGVLSQAPERGVLFGRRVRTIESEIARLEQLSQRFQALPSDVRQSLEGQRAAIENLANSARRNPAGGVSLLADAIDRLGEVVRRTEAGVRQFSPIQGNAEGVFGPTIEELAPRTSLDPTGRTIQQRAADIAAERARREAQEEAEADQRRRREVATSLLPPVIDRPDPLAETRRRQQAVSDRLGPDIESAAAATSRLEAATVQVKGQIDQLPTAFRQRFIPAIRDAENELIRLAGTNASPEDIEAAIQRVVQLRQEVGRTASAVSAIQFPSAEEAINQSALRGAQGRLQAAQRILAQVGAQAGGPVAQAYNRLAQATQRYNDEGTTGTAQAQRALRVLGDELARVASQTGRIRFGTALREIQRGGDVARGSFGNAGLAIQQAAFALDDFFSVTGGLDQRIRAAGNNISQLGFIIGSTQGLIAGISISIGSQLAVALIRLLRIGEESEAQQRRFAAEIENANEALERQKSIAEKLAESYKSLASSIAEAGLSDSARQSRASEQRFDDVRSAQLERRSILAQQSSSGISGLGVIRSQFEQNLRDATDPGVARTFRAAIQSVERDILEFVSSVERQAGAILDEERAAGGDVRRNITNDLTTSRQTLATLQAAQQAGGGRGVNAVLDRQIEETDRIVAALAVARQRLDDEANLQTARIGQVAGNALGRAQSVLQGIDGLTETSARASEASERLRQLLDDATSRPVDAVVQALGRFADSLEQSAIGTAAFSRSLQSAAVDLARNLEEELGSRANELRREANRSEARFGAGDPRTLALRNATQQAQDAARSQTSERLLIDEQVNRIRSVFESAAFAGSGRGPGGREAADLATQIQSLRSIAADTTRSVQSRRGAEIEADLLAQRLSAIFDALPEVAALRARADAGDVRAQQQQRSFDAVSRGAELSLSPARAFAEELSSGVNDIRAFYSQLAEATTGVVDFAAQNAAIQRLVDQGQVNLLRTRSEQASASVREEIGRINATAFGLVSAGLAQPVDASRRAADARRRAIEGITDGGLSERQQADRQIEEQLALAEAQAAAFVRNGDRLAAFESLRNNRANLARQQAPLLVGFAEEVQNAILQGPSRASLSATDASTLEGQRELNRLLRGEDSARDVNLVELQKQTQSLQNIDVGINNTLQRILGVAQQ
jgi:hypothetical protein